MIEDRLSNSLTNMGYKRVDSKATGIYLFYHIEENDLTIVSVIHAVNGNEFAGEQYQHILEQIRTNFKNAYPHNIRLLSLILTKFPDKAKHLCLDTKEDSHWIVDINSDRLIIYETQSIEFTDLRKVIEQLLEEEQLENPSKQDSKAHQRMQGSPARKLKLFTLMNTIIIAINIIVFLVMHYTKAFGGEGPMVEGGALSWYFVKEQKEYYRVITSMFMHADWSHLFNNMVVLLFVGVNLERAAGKIKYLFLYFGTGIIAGITSIGYNMWKEYAEFSYEHTVFSIGASGAIFGVVGAMLYVVIANRGKLEDLSTRQMILFVVFSLYGGISNAQIDQAAHIGGFIAGLLLAIIVYRRPKRISAAV
ncbi:MAG: rhomboid family intramembrane serine protease [Mobilitalea sp.]